MEVLFYFSKTSDPVPSHGYQIGGLTASANNKSLITYKGWGTVTESSSSADEGYQYPWLTVPLCVIRLFPHVCVPALIRFRAGRQENVY